MLKSLFNKFYDFTIWRIAALYGNGDNRICRCKNRSLIEKNTDFLKAGSTMY